MFDPRNILVPTDFSEDSDRAFRTALDIAGKGRSRVFLLHVISRTVLMSVSDYCIDQRTADRVLNQCIVYSNEKLRETLNRFPEIRDVKVIPDLRKGQAHEEILSEASERKVDLIVIASHGKSGLKKYFIGSVAEKVMKEAKCPVLLIRNPERKEGSRPAS